MVFKVIGFLLGQAFFYPKAFYIGKVINRVGQYNYLWVLFEEGGTGRAKSERIFGLINGGG